MKLFCQTFHLSQQSHTPLKAILGTNWVNDLPKPAPGAAPWQCQGQRGQVSAPGCVTTAVSWQGGPRGQLAGSQGSLTKPQRGCRSRSCNSVTRHVMQSEGCLEVFQNTEFSTIKKSERKRYRPDSSYFISYSLRRQLLLGSFHINSLIRSIMEEQLPHTFNAHTAQEVTEVTLHQPVGVLPSCKS